MGIPREPCTKQGLRRDYTPTPQITKSYLLGALHDATSHRTTYRIATKYKSYARVLQKGIQNLKNHAWIYREGKHRHLWIVEFSKTLLHNSSLVSQKDQREYVCGYFDAEGGVAKKKSVRYYIYFAQKNKKDVQMVKDILEANGIRCGILHNPSRKIDPLYWRFFIRASSYELFARLIGSHHPIKKHYLRMKI